MENLLSKIAGALHLKKEENLFSIRDGDFGFTGYRYVCECRTVMQFDGLKPASSRCPTCLKTIDIVDIATRVIQERRLKAAKSATEEQRKALLGKPITAEEMRWFASELPKGNQRLRFAEDLDLPPGLSQRDGAVEIFSEKRDGRKRFDPKGPRFAFDNAVETVYEPADPAVAGDSGNYEVADPGK